MVEELYLGYDASCGDCAQLADTIREFGGERVNVISLRSPVMEDWRAKALGPDAPWAPTLVVKKSDERNRDEDSVKAYVGWQIGPVLARHLDVSTTWNILAAIGGQALEGRPRRGFVTRSAFLRGAVGSIVGATVLLKSNPAAAAARGGKAGAKLAENKSTTVLTGPAMVKATKEALASADVQNVVDVKTLTSSKPLTQLTGADLRAMDQKTGVIGASGAALEVHAVRAVGADGIAFTAVGLYHRATGSMVISHLYDRLSGGVLSTATRYHAAPEKAGVEPNPDLVETSVNGLVPFDVPEDLLLKMAAADPCGGCRLRCGPGNPCGERYLDSTCTAADWKCAYGAAGCASGIATCIGPGFFWCVVCIATACPGTIWACCPERTRRCVRCAYPT